MSEINISKSRALGSRVVYEALKVLSENGGQMRRKEVIDAVEKRVILDDWALEQYEKTGYIRWQSMLHFFSIDCIKAGFLVKKKGLWFLTPEGEQALNLGAIGLLNDATKKYRACHRRFVWMNSGEKEQDLTCRRHRCRSSWLIEMLLYRRVSFAKDRLQGL